MPGSGLVTWAVLFTPPHSCGAPKAISAVGAVPSPMVNGGVVTVQPNESVTVAVYVPAPALMVRVVAPVDQRYEVPSDAVSVMVCPGQSVTGPRNGAVITGRNTICCT